MLTLFFIACGTEDVDISINGTTQPEDTTSSISATAETPKTESFGSLLEVGLQFFGEEEGDRAGFAVYGGGNLDGDAKAEILIGAYGADPNGVHSGKAYLFYGASLGSESLSLSQADHIFVGEEEKDHLGMNLIFAPGLRTAGSSDIILAAPYNKKIYIFLSDEMDRSEQLIPVTEASYTLIGENAGDYIGWSMSTGDFDGDGRSDLLIGADGSDYGGFSAGLTYMMLGGSLGSEDRINMELSDYKFIGAFPGENSGQATAAGDLDGDGLSDIIIGADGNDREAENGGAIYIVYADSLFSLDLFLDGADVQIFHDTPFAEAGSALAAGNDATGDGLDDILVGAPSPEFHSTQHGNAYLLAGGDIESGALEQAPIRFEGNADNAGWDVEFIEDLDGDSAAEILIGAPMLYSQTDTGRSYLWMSTALQLGVLPLRSSPYALRGAAQKSRLGKAVAQAGDINGDGYSDILIGAPEGGANKEGVISLINMIE